MASAARKLCALECFRKSRGEPSQVEGRAFANGGLANDGTGDETRTRKVLPPVDFESTASTNSATPALSVQ